MTAGFIIRVVFCTFHATCLSSETHREKQTWRTASLGPAADLHPIVVLPDHDHRGRDDHHDGEESCASQQVRGADDHRSPQQQASDSVIFRGRAYTPDKSPGVLR